MNKKFLVLILSVLSIAQGPAVENHIPIANPDSEILSPKIQIEPDSIQYSKICPYASLSAVSGFGISWRNRNAFKGRAIDVKVGMGRVGFFTNEDSPWISYSYNWCRFCVPTNNSPYLSWGLGSSVPLRSNWKKKSFLYPHAPLRVGYQFEHGFIDVGVNMVFLMLPIFESRAGINF